MKTITLVSHYFDFNVHLLVSEDTYNKLLLCGEPMDLINDDLDRYAHKERPLLLSEGQCRRIRDFFSEGNTDYFDRVHLN